uniref:Uncharacterized protein n=1 Tax=Eptatretus burgeri TaxID=7764 RepID=A0A8C4WWU1_EPTBU
MEPNKSPKKLQFATPSIPEQLDPQSAEQIRRRRPTPAQLDEQEVNVAGGFLASSSFLELLELLK